MIPIGRTKSRQFVSLHFTVTFRVTTQKYDRGVKFFRNRPKFSITAMQLLHMHFLTAYGVQNKIYYRTAMRIGDYFLVCIKTTGNRL